MRSLLLFQSTPPVKAATLLHFPFKNLFIFQSTPPVKAATYVIPANIDDFVFQSTPPVKAATLRRLLSVERVRISIHAAREGGDETCENITYDANDFNPRRP